jgi:hypothetical protein
VLVTAALLVLRLHYQPPTVPAYVIDRADPAPAAPVELRPGGRFVLQVRPLGPVEGAVGARTFLVRDDTVRAWEAPFAVSRDGSVRIEGPVESLFAGVPAGAWDVAVAVGRPENLPTAPRDVLRARDGSLARSARDAAAWHLVVERVRLGG